ncbi:bifunctional trypsin-like peptidase domain-containing/SEL1-like repeat protein [Streptomyces sp. fd1-xmd]|uniref:bifunctional trypsin-like peptidase domain-containing/SEL1-like repeat protein n=1 Tax=Streptomyces sp. fd1-xmd TaxID=1812480 RepID=UPI00135207FB|nr:bifunctional trypsin-like peptidase domain-containing/SEL1-like repeat protein [Streptomyces sp. fd1-xmd]
MGSEILRKEILSLLERCTVQVHGPNFAGTGFFIAPGVVLTCAHVLKDAGSQPSILWEGRHLHVADTKRIPAEPGKGDFYSFPDLGLIQIEDPPTHPYVRLASQDPSMGSVVFAVGFSSYTIERGLVHRDGLAVTVASSSSSYLRVKDDQVVRGLSGSPVIDPASGRVCGVMKASRHVQDQRGGWIVPASAIAEYLPAEFHLNSAGKEMAEDWARTLQPAPPTRAGAWPLAKHADLLSLGVHRTTSLAGGGDLPPYVQRDIDEILRDSLKKATSRGGFVLITGDSTAGKTRTALEAVRAVLPEFRLVAPEDSSELEEFVSNDAASPEKCVVFLDDLENFFSSQGLDQRTLSTLHARAVTVVATMRSSQYETFVTAGAAAPAVSRADAGHIDRRSIRLLRSVEPLHISRSWSEGELSRARNEEDERITDALVHSDKYGVSEYLAAGPQLLQEWRHASRVGGHPRGAALVRAAVDLARAGLTSPLPQNLLLALHEQYLIENGGEALRPESIDDALSWAREVRFGTTSLLMPQVEQNHYRPFDYLVDALSRDGNRIPETTWRAAVEHASYFGRERYTVGVAAYEAQEFEICEEIMSSLATFGNMSAAYNLAVIAHQRGDDNRAEEWMRKAANSGHPDAAYALGFLHDERGELREAEDWYRFAAQAGNTEAAFALGVNLAAEGRDSQAESWWVKAAESGHPKAAFNLGQKLAQRGELIHARKWLRQAAEAGHEGAMKSFRLANEILKVGNGDDDIRSLISVAEAGDSTASGKIALHYMALNDLESALPWAKLAAENGDNEACHTAGLILQKLGRPKDALFWYMRSASNGHVISAYNIGVIHQDQGKMDEALDWWRKAAAAGHVWASCNLANILRKRGALPEAEKWGLQAATAGNVTAAAIVADVYSMQDLTSKAEVWWRKAAEGGHAVAAFNLGITIGKRAAQSGNEQLLRKAESWLRQAAAGGVLQGKAAIAELRLMMRRENDGARKTRKRKNRKK